MKEWCRLIKEIAEFSEGIDFRARQSHMQNENYSQYDMILLHFPCDSRYRLCDKFIRHLELHFSKY